MGQILASAVRTANATGMVTGYTGRTETGAGAFMPRGILLIIDVTVAGTGTLTPKLNIWDEGTAAFVAFHTFTTGITGTGDYLYVYRLGEPAASGFITEVELRQFPASIAEFEMNHSDASSWTYSVGSFFYDK